MLGIRLFFLFILAQTCFGQMLFDNIVSDKNLQRFLDVFSNIWIQSLSATLLVSAAPLLVIFLIPDLKNHHNLLKVLLAFAAGGLLGDAFLHLIPHSIDPHDHSSSNHGHSHNHKHDNIDGHQQDINEHAHGHEHTKNMLVGLWVVAGIMAFLCVEKFVRLIKGNHGHIHSIESNSHSSDNNSRTMAKGESVNPEFEVRNRSVRENENVKTDESELVVENFQNEHIKVAGYLNLVADFAHNFTDGLAIGASFLINKNVGIVTTITILFHELPHEIGDYAILIQSGCSRKKAIMLQLVTAIGAVLGTVISLISQNSSTSPTWILPFTAGGFIYISTVSVIPELLQEHTKLSQTISEIMSMIVGVTMMVVIAYFE